MSLQAFNSDSKGLANYCFILHLKLHYFEKYNFMWTLHLKVMLLYWNMFWEIQVVVCFRTHVLTMYGIVLMDSGKSSSIKLFKSPQLTFILLEWQSLCIMLFQNAPE
jgi:hypothetical protein